MTEEVENSDEKDPADETVDEEWNVDYESENDESEEHMTEEVENTDEKEEADETEEEQQPSVKRREATQTFTRECQR